MNQLDQSPDQTPRQPAAKRADPVKILLLFAVALMVLYYILGNLPHESVPSAVTWRTDFNQAADQARSAGKFIFADFYADWCGPCRKMDRDVFSDKQFAASLERAAIPLRVDTAQPAGRQLASRYNVTTIPTYIILTPDGTALARTGGTKTADQLLTLLQNAASTKQP